MPEVAAAPRTVAIIARSALMRSSLAAFIQAIAGLQIVLVTADIEEARRLACTHPPDAMVLDSDLVEASLIDLLGALRGRQPAVYVIVLAESVRQRGLLLTAGAGRVLLKGNLGADLKNALLQEQNPPAQ